MFVRFDNGPEFVAHAIDDWCRFNGQLRDELLNSWRFDSLLEARVIIEDHRIDYNLIASNRHQRPGRVHLATGPPNGALSTGQDGCESRSPPALNDPPVRAALAGCRVTTTLMSNSLTCVLRTENPPCLVDIEMAIPEPKLRRRHLHRGR